MNKKQLKELNQLFVMKNVFLHEGRLYEKLFKTHYDGIKYRFLIREDDYDYVVDKKLIKQLDLKCKELRIK